MPLRYKKRLLMHLKHDDYTPSRIGDLMRDLNIPAEESEMFQSAVQLFAKEGALVVSAGGQVMLPSIEDTNGELVGTFRKNPRGFGFVTPELALREGSVFIPPGETGDALTGDTVRIRLARERRSGGDDRYIGTVVEVIDRKRSTYAGTLEQRGQNWVVVPDGRQLTGHVVIRDAQAKNAHAGDKVVFELVVWPDGDMLGEGVIVRVLGDAGRPDVETQAVIAAYDLPSDDFPEACLDQAREAAASFESQIADFHARGPGALDNRLDLTTDFILTIDPPDAKDYDDAISIRRTDDGLWEVGIHIADVAHYIPPGSALDVEAADRANSCYLPRHVIPMLPEILSNGICSLQEGVPRFCKSAFITYDEQGEVRGEGVAQTLIQSSKRLTYLEAQALIDGDFNEARRHAKTPPRYTDQLIDTLREMDRCAKAIRGRRFRQGMITLDLPEVVLQYDDNGHVVGAEKEDDAFTHKLIEMFMVEANEVVARLAEGLGVPLMRRIHPEPIPGDVDEMRKVAMVAGFRIPRSPSRQELQGLLEATRGKPTARAVHMAVLRTLTKAEYSPALVGHYALASSAYAHFTSPIRRYADLTVHRFIAEYLRRTENGRKRPRGDVEKRTLGGDIRAVRSLPGEEQLIEIGRHATMREVNAETAEKELRNFLVLQLLEKHIGESYPGVVTGVTPRGIFVQIDQYLAEGFIKSDDLPGDVTRGMGAPIWKIDQRSGALTDIRSGRSFNFGDLLTVRIGAVDLSKRQLELFVEDGASRAVGKAKKPVLGKLDGGGMEKARGAGFGDFKTGSQKRSSRSKSRDKNKKQHRRDNG
ncbi:MAG: VacB/RNase II family 3'-5' exoribonuclease [Phycisphaeraceae bacterium]|nr:VacB/RNase II family 3'-5' exoribonuclease [Phycisphaeraceae bacterium]